MSSGLGSSTDASCCVERKIFLSPASASSSARTLASRPTIKGVICCGKMTMSRTGIMGTRFISCFSRVNIRAPELLLLRPLTGRPSDRCSNRLIRLSGLLEQTPINFAGADHVRRDHEIAHLPLHGKVVHQLQHEVFEDHCKPRAPTLR